MHRKPNCVSKCAFGFKDDTGLDTRCTELEKNNEVVLV